MHKLSQLSDYLVRLSRALCWNECTGPPAAGTDTTLLAETLLERAERVTTHHGHHTHDWDAPPPHHHHFHSLRLRRERSCHDIPMKEVLTNLIPFKLAIQNMKN